MARSHRAERMHYDSYMPDSHGIGGSTRDVILLGAGGHARVLLDLLTESAQPVSGLLDDDPALRGTSVDGVACLGEIDLLRDYDPDAYVLVNAVGSAGLPVARSAVYARGHDAGFVFETLVHPRAVVSSRASLGSGAQVLAGAVVGPGAAIDEDAIINTRASIDHDSVVGRHTHVAPGATICGQVSIGTGCHIGCGATVIQGVRIGEGVTVAAGAVVIRDIASGETVAGVPARQM